MSVISIGIQTIMPKTGTSQQSSPPRSEQTSGADDAAADKPAPPPAGMGKYVDKRV